MILKPLKMALMVALSLSVYKKSALSETITFECKFSNGLYYIRVGEPSVFSRFTNNDFRSDNVQIRYVDDPQFTNTNVTRSDENGIIFTVQGTLHGAPPEANVTQVVLSRADPPQGVITHWKVVGTESGIGAGKKIDWQNTQLGSSQVLLCHRFVKAF